MTWKRWNNPKEGSWHFEAKAEKLNDKSPPWSDRYPRLASIMNDSPQEPLYNPILRKVFIDTTKQVCRFDGNVKKLIDKLEIEDNLVVNTSGETQELVTATKIQGFKNLGGPGTSFDPGVAEDSKLKFQQIPESQLLQDLPSF